MPNIESVFKNNILINKTALISGGAGGIGFEIALQLGLHGSNIVLMGRRLEPLQNAQILLKSKGIKSHILVGDVRNLDDCKRFAKESIEIFGSIDILVNNAAGNFLATAEDLSPNGFRTVLDIDTMGVVNCCHACFPFLKQSAAKKDGDAVIINISATLHYGATYYQAHSSAAKAAIDSITRSYGLEWASFGIRTVGIAPGPTADTAGLKKLSGAIGEEINEMMPLGRIGTKTDIGMTAVFVASRAATYITGETIVVDGACWMWKPRVAPAEDISKLSKSVESISRKVGIINKSKL